MMPSSPLASYLQHHGMSLMASSTDAKETSCWICLRHKPDEYGKPIVRGCSCRGHSGFVHLSCIIKYAKEKSKAADNYTCDTTHFIKPWKICPRCEQEYQHELSLDLANALLSFVEENYPQPKGFTDYLKEIGALGLKNQVLQSMARENPDSRVEAKKVAKKILEVTEHVRTNILPGILSRIDPSSRDEVLRLLRIKETYAYNQLANIDQNEDIEEGCKEALKHYNERKDSYESLDMPSNAKAMELASDWVKSTYLGEGEQASEEGKSKWIQRCYEQHIEESGEIDATAIKYGVDLALSLEELGVASNASGC